MGEFNDHMHFVLTRMGRCDLDKKGGFSMKAIFHNFYVKPKLPEQLAPLVELAQNIWSTWDKNAQQLFSRIDPVAFRKYDHNPVRLLHNTDLERLQELAMDNGFIYEMSQVFEKFRNYLNFVYRDHDLDRDFSIAYLSMEYGLHESLPVYSGGLGILSGDHLKSASDMGLPLTGFGLLYRYGYFLQKINRDGRQEEYYHENDWFSKAVTVLSDEDGRDLVFKLMVRNQPLFFKVYKVEVGRVMLYLMSTAIEENTEEYRHITDYLYVADRTTRLLQEFLLAFGAFEITRILGLKPSVYHLNEGHSAFLILRRLVHYVTVEGLNIDEARELIACSSVFTTHTPVPAGNEEFESELVRYYLDDYVAQAGMNFDQFAQYANPGESGHFSMPVLAMRFCSHINAVSRIHSEVARGMWYKLFPELYSGEIPIHSVTNGVHLNSWISRPLADLFDRYVGPEYLHLAQVRSMWENVKSIPDQEIWKAHQNRKEQMISFLRRPSPLERRQETGGYWRAGHNNHAINHDHLVIGFARRFASYKRPTLLLHNPERLLRLLTDEERPIQFVFAGKAHPADDRGKQFIFELLKFARENKVEDRFVFLENYDINVARHLVQGVDVWLNNPISPLEASGTSGMKAGMNGVLNLSVLDGWWPECETTRHGWAVSAGMYQSDPELRDAMDADEIYELLENDIAPLFYQRGQDGIPMEWVARMKRSIYDVGLNFNTHRMLHDYLEEFYLPAAERYKLLSRNKNKRLKELLEGCQGVKKAWDAIKFVGQSMEIPPDLTRGSTVRIKADVFLDNASEQLFRVEAFYIYKEKQFRNVPLTFIRKTPDRVAHYEGEVLVDGSGEQSLAIRIKPLSCESKVMGDFVKWCLLG